MNLAFITCFYKTDLFMNIAETLSQNNDIYWITTSRLYRDRLIENKVDKSKILYLNRKSIGEINDNSFLDYVNDIEKKSNIYLNSIYYMDRIIVHWKKEYAMEYFYYVISEVKKFIRKNNIKIITGETTAAHEILTSMIAKEEEILYVNPFTIRFPSDRFCFFYGTDNSKVINIRNKEYMEYDNTIDSIYNDIINENKMPSYWYKNNIIPKYNFVFMKKCFNKVLESLNSSSTDASVKSLKYHLLYEKNYLKKLNSIILKKSNIFEIPDYKIEKFILLPLHKQPEASIDVLGVKYNDQISLIKRIAKELPQGVYIYVKEHTNAYGERNYKILRNIKRIPGVKLVDPYINTRDLIKYSEMVVTISGTVAYEAGIIGKKAVTFANMFFSNLSTVCYAKDEKECMEFLNKDIKQDIFSDRKYIIENILKYSFEGIISDSLNNPKCLEIDNINKINYAYKELINFIEKENLCNTDENFNIM